MRTSETTRQSDAAATLRLVAGVVAITLCAAARAGAIIYVDDSAPAGGDGASWTSALTDLQAALDLAAARGERETEVRVAQGSYTPMGGAPEQTSSFRLVNRVTLAGGYAGVGAADPNARDWKAYPTILDGSPPPVPPPPPPDCCVIGSASGCSDRLCAELVCQAYPPCCTGEWDVICAGLARVVCPDLCHRSLPVVVVPRYHVLRATQVDGAVIDGFTITGGRATGDCCQNDRGGAIYLDHASIVVRNCLITANRSSNVAGGAWIAHSDATFENCTFRGNDSHTGIAIHNVFQSHLILHSCEFIDHVAPNHDSSGGAIFNGGDVGGASNITTVSAVGCTFSRNQAGQGGALYNAGFAELSNCRFDRNRVLDAPTTWQYAGKGGAILNAGRLHLANCTLTGNFAKSGGGLLERKTSDFHGSTTTLVDNCVFWGNTGAGESQDSQIVIGSNGSLVRYSCVQMLAASLPGVGNIGLDPMFVDPLGPDGVAGTGDESFRLQAGSPCIDAGDNAAVPAGIVTDLDGLPRFVDIVSIINHGLGRPPVVDMGAYEVQR